MARMCPPSAPNDEKHVSRAEIEVFEALKTMLPEDWVVLHSLWLRGHPRKMHAEADFVVIAGKAIILLEVKGGVVTRDARGWHFANLSGSQEYLKAEGPFDQVRGAYYAIGEHFKAIGRPDLFYHYVWGYAVITPDCIPRIPATEPSFERDLLLDLTGFPAEVKTFLDRLAGYWTQQLIGKGNGVVHRIDSLQKTLSAKDRETLLYCLRPDFECVRGLGEESLLAEREIKNLTIAQYSALDHAAAEDRNILWGPAGTGKTVLALEQARRELRKGSRVLFTCFSRLLASVLRASTEGDDDFGGLELTNYHQLFVRYANEAGMTIQIEEDWESFNSVVEDIAIAAAESRHFEKYDYLIIDEAQDLLRPEFVSALDLLLHGGIERGRWTICCDPSQAIFKSQFEPKTLELFLKSGRKSALDINCRNTLPVAAYVFGLSNVGCLPSRGANGPQVNIDYYADTAEFKRKLKKSVNDVISQFAAAGISASEIVLLVPERGDVGDYLSQKDMFLRPVAEAGYESSRETVRWSTVHRFKGLEAKAIILAGLQQLDSVSGRELIYVGGSRAKSILRMLLPLACASYVQSCSPQVLQALSSRV